MIEVSGWAENDRGVSFTFGSDVVNKFLNKHDLGESYFMSTRSHSESKIWHLSTITHNLLPSIP